MSSTKMRIVSALIMILIGVAGVVVGILAIVQLRELVRSENGKLSDYPVLQRVTGDLLQPPDNPAGRAMASPAELVRLCQIRISGMLVVALLILIIGLVLTRRSSGQSAQRPYAETDP